MERIKNKFNKYKPIPFLKLGLLKLYLKNTRNKKSISFKLHHISKNHFLHTENTNLNKNLNENVDYHHFRNFPGDGGGGQFGNSGANSHINDVSNSSNHPAMTMTQTNMKDKKTETGN